MEALDSLLADPLASWSLRAMTAAALRQFHLFTLVVVRMGGLMTVGPLFGQSIVPGNVRAFVVLGLALLITPALDLHQDAGFDRLDADRDGRLALEEVPPDLQNRFAERLAASGRGDDESLTPAEYRSPARLPTTLADYLVSALAEFSLGLVLGVGVMTILSGLQLAGDVADQQSGIALGETASPGLEISGSTTGRFLYLFGVTALLVTGPMGYHVRVVQALAETFRTLPAGEAFLSHSAADLLRDLVHQSLVLGVQVAAPLIAVMSLVALTMGFLGHSVPQIQILVFGFPVRILISLLVIAGSLSGIARQVVDVVPRVIDQLRDVIAGLA